MFKQNFPLIHCKVKFDTFFFYTGNGTDGTSVKCTFVFMSSVCATVYNVDEFYVNYAAVADNVYCPFLVSYYVHVSVLCYSNIVQIIKLTIDIVVFVSLALKAD